MIGRVTQQTIQRSTLANLQTNLTGMSNLQNKLSGNSMITKPSDNPAGTASAIALRAGLRANEQASRNIDDGNGWLTTADTTLTSSLDVVRKVRDLTVQGANTGALNPEGREALAVQIEGLRDTLLGLANTEYQGRKVFAGTSDAASAVTVKPAVAEVPPVPGPASPYYPALYSSNNVPGSAVTRRIDANTSIRVDVDGRSAFGDDSDGGTVADPTDDTRGSVFATLDRIAKTLRDGGSVTTELTTLDTHRDAMLNQISGVGARQGQILAAQTRALDTKTTLTTQLSGIEDVDLAATIVELQMQEVAYQAALGAASRVMQPSLLDFLR